MKLGKKYVLLRKYQSYSELSKYVPNWLLSEGFIDFYCMNFCSAGVEKFLNWENLILINLIKFWKKMHFLGSAGVGIIKINKGNN